MRGRREGSAAELEAARTMSPFASIDELARRVPSLSRAGRHAGLLPDESDRDEKSESPLRVMEMHERMVADYASTGVTVGRHPMAHCRPQLRCMEVIPARDLSLLRHGVKTRIAGCVIARQLPGTAHGFIFLSIEDETRISNVIIDPDLYENNRSLVTCAKFLLIEGALQNVDKVIHIRARHIEKLIVTTAPMQSHDWH